MEITRHRAFGHRRSLRLSGYDYSSEGAYFVTSCTLDRVRPFGEVVSGEMHQSAEGRLAADSWSDIPIQFSAVQLDAVVVMPNHVHGILLMTAAVDGCPEGKSTLGQIMSHYKHDCTKRVNALRGTPGVPLWQRGYYDHIIRNDRSLRILREYIANTAMRWELDSLHPNSGAGRAGRARPYT